MMILKFRGREKGIPREVTLLPRVLHFRELVEGGERHKAAFLRIRLGQRNNRRGEGGSGPVAFRRSDQTGETVGGNGVGGGKLLDQFRQQRGIAFHQTSKVGERVIELDPVAAHLAEKRDGSLGRRAFQRGLEHGGDLGSLAPSFRLIVGAAGVGTGAP